ncbi:MAG TPA: hypothetical protein HA262_02500 [Methanosarcina sp.]|jgi:hypothetical protein|nr:hypothetical protein [Methanosarcina sp.]
MLTTTRFKGFYKAIAEGNLENIQDSGREMSKGNVNILDYDKYMTIIFLLINK